MTRGRAAASLLVALAVAACVTVTGSPPATALTCPSPPPLRVRLLEAEAVFVGTVIATRPVPDGDAAPTTAESTLARVRVDRPIKGTFGGDVEIYFDKRGPTVGAQAVYLPHRAQLPGQPERWVVGGVCATDVDDVAAVEAVMAPPPVTGAGPLRHLARLWLGDLRIVALDERLRPLGYGAGPGIVESLAVCPGGRRAVEVVVDTYRLQVVRLERRLAVRDLRTLAVVAEIADERMARTPLRPFDQLTVSCRSAAGDDIGVFLGGNSAQGPKELHRWTSGGWSTPWTGPQTSAAASADGRIMYLVGGPDPLVIGVDTATGRQSTVAATDTSLSGPRLGPDGRTLRVWTATGQWPNERYLEVGLRDGSVRELPPPPEAEQHGTVIPELTYLTRDRAAGFTVVPVPSGPRMDPEYVPAPLALGPGASLPEAPADVEWMTEPAPTSTAPPATGAPPVTADVDLSSAENAPVGRGPRGGGVPGVMIAALVALLAAAAAGGALVARHRRR